MSKWYPSFLDVKLDGGRFIANIAKGVYIKNAERDAQMLANNTGISTTYYFNDVWYGFTPQYGTEQRL